MERQFENLIREAKVRRGLIVYGNTRDEYLVKEDKKCTYLLLAHYLRSILRQSGFEVIGRWNAVEGLRFDSDLERGLFARWVMEEEQDDDEGEEYDAGDITPNVSLDLPPMKDFCEMVGAVSRALENNDRPSAFIVEWGDYVYGSVQRPFGEDERQRMLLFSRMLSGRFGYGRATAISKRSPGVVILLTSSLGAVPAAVYQHESRIKLFNLGLPEKSTRTAFLENHLEELNLKTTENNDRARTIDELADMTEGMSTIDLIQMVKLASSQKGLTPEKLLNLYRFGEKKSPWEELSYEKLKSVEDTLKERVIGQDGAVRHVGGMIIKASMGLSGAQHSVKMTKPKGVLFFVGPTGVGKTELAKSIAKFLFGDEDACIRFDMSEYSHEESDQRLIGAPPGYVGFEEGGQLINAVLERPFSVLLFDEIEKAHPKILDKFLQVLEDGRMTDGRGVTAYFSETVIIFTSNIGSSEVDLRDGKANIESEFKSRVKDHFNNLLKRPELLNRIGENIVVFNPITDKAVRTTIIRKKLEPIRAVVMAKHDVDLVFDKDIYRWIESRSDVHHGGRGLLNALERDLMDPLSRFIFVNKKRMTKGRWIEVRVSPSNEELQFDIQER